MTKEALPEKYLLKRTQNNGKLTDTQASATLAHPRCKAAPSM
ncbi:MAG: hypothetical protein ORN51_04485 [Akkermansiaceae bacterium]|nr:hypothetical protein [Akkermansiaceae bacterium]